MSKAKLYKKLKQLSLLSLVGVTILLLIFQFLERMEPLNVNTEPVFTGSAGWLLLVLALAGLNWALEILKWHQLINTLERQTYWESTKAVLLGVALGIITPNRIGEYGGRVIFLEPENKKKGLSLTLLSSFYQLLVTLIFGLIALVILVSFFHLKLPFAPAVNGSTVWIGISILAIGFGLLLFFRARLLDLLKEWLSNIRHTISRANAFKKTTFLLSFFRYLVFTFQFGILLIWLGAGISFMQCILMVALLFFLNTVSPGGFLLNLGWRTATAALLFSLVNANLEAVILSAVLIWMVNLFIPGIFGAIWLKDVKRSSFSWK